MNKKYIWLCAIVGLLAFSQLARCSTDLEGLDDSDVAINKAAASSPAAADDQQAQVQAQTDAPAATEKSPQSELDKEIEQQSQRIANLQRFPKLIGQYELACVVFLVAFTINWVIGRSFNRKLADAWAAAYAPPGGIIDKNFAHMGPSDLKNGLMADSANVFKCYASGRRHVQGMLATLQLKARQDLLTSLWYIVSPTEDTVTFEAHMAESSMPQIVLAVGIPRAIRQLKDSATDVATYTKKMGGGQVAGWPSEKLHIMAEHSAIFTDLFSDSRVSSVFNPKGPHARAFKYFRYLHFSSDSAEGSHKRVLRFCFALPPAGSMSDLDPLVALVPLFIDLVGAYKLSPDLKRKAEVQRANNKDDKKEEEARKARLEALQARKLEKLAEEKAKIARLPPGERERAEDKLKKRQMEKAMKKRMMRVG